MKKSLTQIADEAMEALSVENAGVPISQRTLLRRFYKLVSLCGGNPDALKDRNGHIYFSDEDITFAKYILMQLVNNEGICSKLIDKHTKEDSITPKAIHNFIQGYLDLMDAEGYSEEDMMASLKFFSWLFNDPLLASVEYCHQMIEFIHLNLLTYPYTYQVLEMKKVEDQIKRIFARTVVAAVFEVGELAEFIEKSKSLNEDDIGIQEYFCNEEGEEDECSLEYKARDCHVLQLIQQDDDLRQYVEKRVGRKAEEIFNVAAATLNLEKRGEAE